MSIDSTKTMRPLSFFAGFVLGFLIGAWVVPCMQTHASLIWRPNHEHLVHTNRSGKIAFKNFDSYKVGEWFNYPRGIKVERVQLIRDDGMVQDK